MHFTAHLHSTSFLNALLTYFSGDALGCTSGSVHAVPSTQLLPSPPPIPLHFHWLNPTLISRMISEDFNIFNPLCSRCILYCGKVSTYGCVCVCLLPLYRMNCLQARTICYNCFSYTSQIEGICWIQRFLGGGERKTFMHTWWSHVVFLLPSE